MLLWGEGRVCPGVWLKGWLRWIPHPSGGVECRGHVHYPTFAPNPLLLLLRSGSWVFGLFVSFGPKFAPAAYAHSYFHSHSFFVFCCWRRSLSRCKHCSKEPPGPRLSQNHKTLENCPAQSHVCIFMFAKFYDLPLLSLA